MEFRRISVVSYSTIAYIHTTFVDGALMFTLEFFCLPEPQEPRDAFCSLRDPKVLESNATSIV